MSEQFPSMAPLDIERGYGVGTASGLLYYPANPRPEEINIYDIACQLSRICRFNGALADNVGIYSVAQHSVIVSYLVPQEFALEGLLHDAHEAYVHDIVKPIKMMMPEYADLEHLNELVLRKKFGLPRQMSPEVKEADRKCFATEVRDLCHANYLNHCPDMPAPMGSAILAYTPRRAREKFLARFKELYHETDG